MELPETKAEVRDSKNQQMQKQGRRREGAVGKKRTEESNHYVDAAKEAERKQKKMNDPEDYRTASEHERGVKGQEGGKMLEWTTMEESVMVEAEEMKEVEKHQRKSETERGSDQSCGCCLKRTRGQWQQKQAVVAANAAERLAAVLVISEFQAAFDKLQPEAEECAVVA